MMKNRYKLLFVFLILIHANSFLNATVFTVNTISDASTGSGNAGSLRYCILTVNATSLGEPHRIEFNITGTAPFVIDLTSELPAITRSGTVIDASTQPGFTGSFTPLVYVTNALGIASGFYIDNASAVEIYGFQIFNFATGILINGDSSDGFRIGSNLKKNVINRCSGSQIVVDGADNGSIQGNFLGCDISGTFGYQTTEISGNGLSFLNQANDNTIGGSTNGLGNLIAGGTGAAILIGEYATSTPSTGCSGNQFYGNRIGGTGAEMPWNSWAFWIDGNSDQNIIGGIASGLGNNLSEATNGNTGNGYGNLVIAVNSSDAEGNQLRGNNMSCAYGNGIVLADGGNNNIAAPVIVSSLGNTIQGTAPANALVDLYTGSLCNSVYGNAKGEQFVISVTASPSGDFTADLSGLSLTCPVDLIAIATTATDGSSAFSDAFSFTNGGVANTVFSFSLPVCANDSLRTPDLDAAFTSGGSWSAQFGLVINPQTGNISPLASEPGEYTINYSVSASGCNSGASGTFSIVIDTLPVLSIYPSGFVSVCDGNEVELIASGGFSDYRWNGSAGGAQNLTVSLAGAYSVTALSVNGCVVQSDTVFITEESIPQASFEYSQTEGYIIQFSNTSLNAETYLWDFGAGFSSTEQNPSYNFLFDNVWPVSLIVENACGADTIYQNVAVIKNGISKSSQSVFSWFEKDDVLYLSGFQPTNQISSVMLYSVSGQLISSYLISATQGNPIQIPVAGLAPGVYLIELQAGQSRFNVKWMKTSN